MGAKAAAEHVDSGEVPVFIADFSDFLAERRITVEGAWFLNGDSLIRPALANFRAEHAVFLLSRGG